MAPFTPVSSLRLNQVLLLIVTANMLRSMYVPVCWLLSFG